MANLFTLDFGKISDLLGKLAGAGFTAEMAEEIRKNPALAEVIVKTLLQQPVFTLVRRLFTTTEKQIERVRGWNTLFNWGIPDEAFAAAEKFVPAWPKEKLVAVVLVPYLADKANEDGTVTSGLERTFHELWEVAASQQPAKWRWDGYDKAGPDRLRLLKGIEHKPGLRWEVIDLGCNRNKEPKDFRSAKSSPSAGILAAAALHPYWVKSMDGKKVPGVWIPGYEVQNPEEGSFSCVPILSSDSDGSNTRWIGLSLEWSNEGIDRGGDFAVPSFFRE